MISLDNSANTSQSNSINIIISKPPFSNIDGKEGVDLALVCAAFDLPVNLIFQDSGIFHLIESQDETQFSDKFHDKQLLGLEFYDIEQIYLLKDSLQTYAISQEDLIKSIQLIDLQQLNTMCQTSRNTVIF